VIESLADQPAIVDESLRCEHCGQPLAGEVVLDPPLAEVLAGRSAGEGLIVHKACGDERRAARQSRRPR